VIIVNLLRGPAASRLQGTAQNRPRIISITWVQKAAVKMAAEISHDALQLAIA
jgi:hypothetical protein